MSEIGLYEVFFPNNTRIKISREDLPHYARDYRTTKVIRPDGKEDFLTHGHYILHEDHSVEECFLLLEASEWFERANTKVRRTQIDNVLVSTIFLWLDHGFMDRGNPVLFETMTFRELPEPETVDLGAALSEMKEAMKDEPAFEGLRDLPVPDITYTVRSKEFDGNDYVNRYHTYDEAVKGHEEIVAKVRTAIEQTKLLIDHVKEKM